MSIFFIIFIFTDNRTFKQRKVTSVSSLAQVLGTNCISTLQFQDSEAARKILSELRNVAPDVIYAGVFDKSGKPFASFNKAGSDSIRFPPDLQNQDYLFTANHLFVSNSIINDNEIIGKVLIVTDLVELKAIRKSKSRIAMILLLLALGFSFLISIPIQTYISWRLLRLVRTMKEVRETGNYGRPIKDEGKDEISILNREFDNLMQQVKESQQRKDDFISVASHELKTPLTSIKGYLDLLSSMEERHPNKQFVQKTLGNVHKLEMLIKDLLDVSKIQSGQLELNIHEFNIDSLMDETISAIQMVTSGHVIIREQSFNNLVVFADRMRIEQVLTNLLANAIKYSPGEERVIVYSHRTDTEVIVQIRDFGIGIPVEELSNIFERFYRTKDISVTITGFGLGLYICRDIIHRHHGRIWVEPQEKGSAFFFSLPVKVQKSRPEEQKHIPAH